MPFWPSYSLIQKFLLVDLDDISVLGMHNTDSSKVPRAFKGFIHGDIIDSKHVVVSHEEFKAGNTIFHHSLHLAWSLPIPLYYGRVQTIITVDFWISPSPPGIHCVSQGFAFVRDGKVNK